MEAALTRLPPRAVEDTQAELDLVGRCLALGQIHPDARHVTPGMISDRELREAWRLLLAREGRGESCAWVEVQHETTRLLGDGFTEQLRQLRRRYTVGESAGLYATRVRDAWARRELQELGLELEELPRDRTRTVADLVSEVATRAEALLGGVALPASTVEDLVSRSYVYFRDAAQRRSGGTALTLGLDGSLDGLVRELWLGEMTVVGARPSCGKTAFAMNVARNAMASGRKVLFVSLETREERLVCNLLAQVTKTPMRELEAGSMSVWAAAEQRLRSLPGSIRIVDRGVQTPADLDEVVVRGGFDLVIVDYLQLLRPERKDASRYETVTEASVALKRIAVKRNLHLIALAQLSRANTQRADKRPTMADLRESGQIEQDADVVILLHRESQFDSDADPRDLEVFVAKNRNGAAGEGVLCSFDPTINRIEKAPWRPPTNPAQRRA